MKWPFGIAIVVCLALGTYLLVSSNPYPETAQPAAGNVHERSSGVRRDVALAGDQAAVQDLDRKQVDETATGSESERDQTAKRLRGEHWARFAKLKQRFDQSLAGASSGVPGAALELDEIAFDCEPFSELSSAGSPEEVWPDEVLRSMSPENLEYWSSWIGLVFDDCKYVLSNVPDGLSPTEWGAQILSSAADSGSALGILKLEEKNLLRSEGEKLTRDGWIRLTDKAVRSLNHHAFGYLRAFMSSESDSAHDQFIRYAECRLDSYCDLDFWLAETEDGARLRPRQVEQFELAIERLAERVLDPSPLPLASLEANEFQSPNGSFWFE